MMTLIELKDKLESKTFTPCTAILISEDKFVPLQYVEYIKKELGIQVYYIDSLSELSSGTDDIFFSHNSIDDSALYVFNTDVINYTDDSIFNIDNVIIIANKIDNDAKKFYSDILIEIPKLDDWQIEDMLYSMCDGVEPKYLDWLFKNCNGDANRLYNESLKLSIFNKNERNTLFIDMCDDGAFDDLSSHTVFNLINGLMCKDIKTVLSVMDELNSIEITDFGFLTLLYNNVRNVISIQLGKNITAEKLGMKPSQFNAVKRVCGHYHPSALVELFRIISSVDKMIKDGYLPSSNMIDYIVTNMLCR